MEIKIKLLSSCHIYICHVNKLLRLDFNQHCYYLRLLNTWFHKPKTYASKLGLDYTSLPIEQSRLNSYRAF